MSYLPDLTSRTHSRRWPLVLVLAALCVVLTVAQGLAEAQPVTGSLQAPAVTALTTVDFLASLSAAPSGAQNGDRTSELLPPAPAFLSGCTSNAQCPPGQICCLACGYAGCERRACFATKTCPHFP